MDRLTRHLPAVLRLLFTALSALAPFVVLGFEDIWAYVISFVALVVCIYAYRRADHYVAPFMLALRLAVGVEWLVAGLHKLVDARWMETGQGLGSFLAKNMANNEAMNWLWKLFLEGLTSYSGFVLLFGIFIVFAELAVGLGLITGVLTRGALVGGLLMNGAFLMTGAHSSNPTLILLEVLMLAALPLTRMYSVRDLLQHLPGFGGLLNFVDRLESRAPRWMVGGPN